MKRINGKIGFALNIDLGIKGSSSKGHYVYIRRNHGDTVDVNVVTSLEDKDKNFVDNKIRKVRRGSLYQIPYQDANFSRWSAIDLNSKIFRLDKRKIMAIDSKKINDKHKIYIGKFGK